MTLLCIRLLMYTNSVTGRDLKSG